jgi:hypothetical protein
MLKNKKMVNKTSSILKITFIAFLLVFVLTPTIVDGFAFDLAIMQLEAISEKTSPIMAVIILSFVFFAVSFAALWISTTLLQAVIDISPEALTVMGGDAAPMVQAGWNFTVGIGNMLLILAFVVIALSTILGYENYHFKKLLPRLIVVALLMNFTLLFVGIGIDISNFLFNSVAKHFSEDGGNILFSAIEPILDLGSKFLYGSLAVLVGLIVLLLIPYVNVAVQVGWIVAFTMLLPFLLQLIITGGILFLMSATFFFYFVVFVARIFIVQILAILGPLAFFSLIFPKTENWWSKWLTYLVQWLFIGVIFIFLMYIGLALAPLTGSLIQPMSEAAPAWLRPILESNLVSHLILLIYFIVIFGVIKSFIPDLAKTIVAQGTAIVKAALPYAGAIGKGGKKYYQHQIAENKPLQNRMSEWSKSTPPPGGGSILEKSSSFMKRNIGTKFGPEIKESEKKSVNEFADSLKDSSPEKIANSFRSIKGDATSEIKKLGSILAAHRAGQLDKVLPLLNDMLNTQDDFDRLFEKAESSGHKSEIKKALPVHFMERETRGLNDSEKEEKVKDFVLGDLKGDNMEKASPQIVEAINKGTAEQMILGQKFIKAIMESKDTSYFKNFTKGSEGISGVEIANRYIDIESAKTPGRDADNPKHRFQTVKDFNPQMAKEIKTKPGQYMIDVDPT